MGTRFTLDWGTTYEVDVLDLGLACCGVEVMAALHGRGDDQDRPADLGVRPVSGAGAPERAHVLVVSGTVTDVMLPAVLATYERMPEPRYVLSVGACSNTGGPYWDSYSVTKGVDQVLPVHVAVPGCPPRPEALLEGLVALHRMVTGEVAA
ncbi:NADH-quinone oxidoreductase subunit B [Streptoalloteichus hindustanus]|uniref:NADH-quinone oxidoreductase subunit B n=1 Tax=Streptoalloteichus hindustanus TaxID=2017 RepID=A0A1M4TMN2_STRHI|nr:NADH-quinone oxidoreductase subunit NuoB [Streptoalloteichus hindustanus]SHE45698.1 NADH-quinone oxidoreductase subunit B [Streptoalloteichus hindustanus]